MEIKLIQVIETWRIVISESKIGFCKMVLIAAMSEFLSSTSLAVAVYNAY